MHDLRFFHTDLGLRIAETFSRQLENRAATSSNLYLVANLAPVVHDPKRARSPTPEDHATRGSQRSRIALLTSQFTLAANHAPRAVRLMTVEFVRTSVYFCGTTRYHKFNTAQLFGKSAKKPRIMLEYNFSPFSSNHTRRVIGMVRAGAPPPRLLRTPSRTAD